jgi:hypothetical protein
MEKPVQTTPSRRVKFGSPETSLVTKSLAELEKRPLAELLLKDVAAFNIPKIALSRTWKERWDTATLELSNSGITLLSSLVLPPLVRWPVNQLANLSEEYVKKEYLGGEFKNVMPKLTRKQLLPTQMARMGASFGFFFPFAAAFWAAPFARNWLTAKRTHSANFESMIGFDGLKTNQPKRTLDEEMAYQRNTAFKVLGTGVGLGIASIFAFGLTAHSLGKNMGKKIENQLLKPLFTEKGSKAFQKFFNAFDLKGNQVNGQTATLVFWGLPAYLGWVHGARSGNERRERVVQSANAIFWFFFASKLTNPLWRAGYQKAIQGESLTKCQAILDTKTKDISEKLLNLKYEDILTKFEKGSELQNKLLALKNCKFALNDLGIPIATLSTVQFFNFNLTEKKIKNSQSQPQMKLAQPSLQSVSNQPFLSVVNQPFSVNLQQPAFRDNPNWLQQQSSANQ